MRWPVWAEAFEVTGVDATLFLGTIPVHARLPWDHIHVGLEDGFLLREYRKALKNRLSPPCGKVAGAFVHATNLVDAQNETRKLVCYDCGVACDMTQMREERLVFLRTLGAHEPPPAPAARAPGKVKPMHEQPPTRLPQGAPRRIRIGYRKLGRAAYRGHLDLVRVLPRILRRIEMPLFYTQGYHPKPEMVFGPALSLGTASLSEFVDVKLDGTVPFDLAGVVERLNRASELGLEVFGVAELGAEDPGINKVLDEAAYVVGLAREGADVAREIDALRARVEARLADARAGLASLVVLREIDGIGKKIDVLPYLLEVAVGEGREELARAGIAGTLLPIRMRLRVTGSGGTKPSEVIEALLGEREPALRLVRTHLGLGALSPLELDAVRAAKRAAHAAARDADTHATEAAAS
jgi:radical SAM-linked protein